jgi:hypothetical protein
MIEDDVTAEMKRHARSAVEMVMAEYGERMEEAGLQLDFSEKTIGLVESLLDNLHKAGNNTEELVRKFSLLFGAYIGEMIRDCFPEAQWVAGENDEYGPGAPFLELKDIKLFPITWCYKRLYNGPQDSVVKKYLAFRAEIDARTSSG